MSSTDITVTGLENIQYNLKQLQKNSDNLQPVLEDIGNKILNVTTDSFEKEQSPFGKKWAPLKVISYHLGYTVGLGKKAYTKSGAITKRFSSFTKNKKILHLKGKLANNWDIEADSNEVMIFNPTKSKGFAYGLVHQLGGKKVVARPFLPIDTNGNLEPKLNAEIMQFLTAKIMSLG